MSHEIYYTSAPEGIKRGTSGFCTVGASANIPKPLWDRLETLSAYRHQFGAGGQTNPISFAHWILNISGKTHHVLSRICDSGVDHTHRTNAFAHHLALDAAEIAAAPGGPAWMLQQPGVMTARWDGRVGTLHPSPLASGDSGPRICHAWEAMTGDSGWGGHLAELFAKSPTRPVCILFAPGQDLLPLLEESIALLPPAARWNVTFNTYFTSMPTSATCLWRCCLAGTPAAQTGLRYAANGLILDLTDRTRLPALPPSDYVTMARTGRSTAPASKAGAAKPAPASLAELKARAASKSGAAPAAPTLDFAGRRDADRRAAEEDFDKFVGDLPQPQPAAETQWIPEPAANQEPYDLQEPASTPVPPPRRGAGPRLIRRAEDALEEAERQAASDSQRRRRQVLLLFAGAVAALAVATGVIFYLNRNSAPPELPRLHPTSATHSSSDAPDTQPIAPPTDTHPVAINTLPGSTTSVATAQSQPVQIATQTAPAPVITYPAALTLGSPITKPDVGTGFGDRQQTLPLKASELAPGAITRIAFEFFPTQPDKASTASPPAYKNKSLGTLTAVSGSTGGLKNIALYWKADGDPGLGTEIVLLAVNPAKPCVEVTWHAAALMRASDAYSYIFWTLQNSDLIVETAAAKQHIKMNPFNPEPLNYTAPSAELKWPADLPHDVQAIEPPADALPSGWKASWYLDWDAAIPMAGRTADNAFQVMAFKKPTAVPTIDAWFLLKFKPGASGGIDKVESTYAATLQQIQASQAKAAADLAAITKKITDLKNDPAFVTFQNGMVPADLLAKQASAQTTFDAYNVALGGYDELKQFDVTFELSDKVRLATRHFQRPDTETGK